MSEDDPVRIGPTIAQVPPVSSKELFLRHKARFSNVKLIYFQQNSQQNPTRSDEFYFLSLDG